MTKKRGRKLPLSLGVTDPQAQGAILYIPVPKIHVSTKTEPPFQSRDPPELTLIKEVHVL